MRLKFFAIIPVFWVFVLGVYGQKDPVVMTIEGEKVTKSEFLRVYLKNNNDPKYDKESLDEYMDLYKKFKLKVKEAEALQYDTLPSLRRELMGYKKQLAQPYLVDTTKNNELISEAYQRMKQEVRASHILISLGKNPTPEDTLKAYNKALDIKKRIDEGEEFAEVAVQSSEDPSAKQNQGDLGYFTAFQMVYPFETAAYETPIGKASMPVRTSYGYHIVNVVDKRPARGTITVAHLMIVPSQDQAKKKDYVSAEKKINEIYEKLLEGEEFEKMVRLYSDDQGSKANDGLLPSFGSGTNQRMVSEFEDAAFAIKNNGEISAPVKTDYGYHIIKRLDYKPLGTFDELIPTIKQKINQGDRSKQSENSFISHLKKENKFKEKGSKQLKWFKSNIDTTIFRRDWIAPDVKKNKVMFIYNKKKYKSQDFMGHLATHKNTLRMDVGELINQRYEEWQNDVIMEDEKSQLETKYPEYKALVQEYHDGILLYEIMKDKVWDKAIKDTAGLENYFESNITKYQWPDRIEATVFSSIDKDKVIEAGILANSDTLGMAEILRIVNAESELNLKAEYGKFVQSEKAPLKGRTFYEGNNEIYQFGDKYYLVRVENLLPAGPKELNETRGAVIQDYQDELERNWLKELNEKHTITIDEKVLYNIGE